MKRVLSFILIMITVLSSFSVAVAAEDGEAPSEAIDITEFNFPVISVTTEKNAPIVDKENYVTCKTTIENTDDSFCAENLEGGIRFRGNSTFTNSNKKAYRIKFSKKQNLFGMGKAKSWVLLANSFDKTMVRNAVAFSLASKLGLEYTSEFRFVNLYINGECKGLYLLCEQTQAGSTRVDIEEDETGKVDTGYLIEFVGNGDTDEDAYFEVKDVDTSLFPEGVTNNWRTNVMKFIIKTPEKEFCTSEQLAFISDYCNTFNKAILTHDWDTFSAYCDVDSFVKFFVVNTVMNNGDGGYQIYFYKKENGGKVYAGPVWDFDQSAAASTHCSTAYDKWYHGSSNPWFDSFVVWDEFMSLARRCYSENIDEIKKIINFYTCGFYENNKYDFDVNDLIWNSVSSDYWRITEEVSALKTYEDNFKHLNTWFSNRLQWLDSKYHKLGEYSYDNNETCVSDGTESASCDDCEYTSYRTVAGTKDPDKHSYGSYTYNNDATCVSDGTESAECGDCKKVDTRTAVGTKDPDKHSYGSYTYNNDATCVSDGTKSRVCECNKVETVPDPEHKATGHVKQRVEAKAPTFTENGNREYYICLKCHKLFSDEEMSREISESDTVIEKKQLPTTVMYDSSKVFTDVLPNAWYKEYVDYAYSWGMLRGMSETEFEPQTELTRAMFVTVLARLDGVNTDINDTDTPFVDVKSGKYYTAAVKWAFENGIVDGVAVGVFEPDGCITREQLCAMVVRYCTYAGVELNTDISSVAMFDDDAKIREYARSAVYICRASGIVNGTEEDGKTLFRPRHGATRAEISKILSVLHERYLLYK